MLVCTVGVGCETIWLPASSLPGKSNGFKASDCREAAWLAAQSYRTFMAAYADMSVLDAWYDAMDFNDIIDNMQDKEMKRFYTKKLAATEAQGAHEKEFARLAHSEGFPARIIDQPPLIYHYGDMRDEDFSRTVRESLDNYVDSLPLERHLLLQRYELVDVAMKVVGVGSVGTFCGIALMMSGNGDPLFLQFKEARQSVLERLCRGQPIQTLRTAGRCWSKVNAGGQ